MITQERKILAAVKNWEPLEDKHDELTPYGKTIHWAKSQILKAEIIRAHFQKLVDADNAKKQRHWTVARRQRMFRLVALGGKLCAYKQSLDFLNSHPSL